jgi:hypothetical protein
MIKLGNFKKKIKFVNEKDEKGDKKTKYEKHIQGTICPVIPQNESIKQTNCPSINKLRIMPLFSKNSPTKQHFLAN